MSILINESNAPVDMWLGAGSSLQASFSQTPIFATYQKPVQNVPLRLATCSFPATISKGASATGWIYFRNLLSQSITGNLYITTDPAGSISGCSFLTITLPQANSFYNISSLQCSATSGSAVYLYFVPTSAITDSVNTLRAFPSAPTSIAYSSMPSNAWNTTISSTASSVWIKAI